MDKATFDAKVYELIGRLPESLIEECNRLFKCGGIDTEHYPDDYILPRVIFTVALENIQSQYFPPNPGNLKEIRNLRKF